MRDITMQLGRLLAFDKPILRTCNNGHRHLQQPILFPKSVRRRNHESRKAKELGLTWQRGGHKRKPKPTWPFDRTPSQPGDCRRKLEGNSVHRAAGTIRDHERSRWQAVRGIA